MGVEEAELQWWGNGAAAEPCGCSVYGYTADAVYQIGGRQQGPAELPGHQKQPGQLPGQWYLHVAECCLCPRIQADESCVALLTTEKGSLVLLLLVLPLLLLLKRGRHVQPGELALPYHLAYLVFAVHQTHLHEPAMAEG